MSEGDKLWNLVLQTISQKIHSTTDRRVILLAGEIKKQIDDLLQRNFYSEVIQNLDRSPWNAYSKRYARKQKVYAPHPKSWMKYSGDMVEELLGRNPLEDFGTSQVEIVAKRGSKLAPGVQLDSRGRPQYTAGARPQGVRGGYVSFADAFLDSERSIRIKIWPGKTGANLLDSLPDDPSQAIRFGDMKDSTYKRAGLRTRLGRFEFGSSDKRQAARPVLRLTMLKFRTQTVPKLINEIIR